MRQRITTDLDERSSRRMAYLAVLALLASFVLAGIAWAFF